MNRTLIGIAAVLMAVHVFDAQPVSAQDRNIVLQIKPLAMPAVTDKGYRGRMTMTPYVEVTDADAVERLCGRLPRLMDAILVAFEEDPVQLADTDADMMRRQEAMRTLVDTTIGTGVFETFYLVQGSVDRGAGTEMISVVGGTRECQPIRALPWDPQVATAVDKPQAATDAAPVLPEGTAPSPLSEAALLKAEAELMAENPIRAPFPGEPKLPSSAAPSPLVITLVIAGLGGLMLIIGSYIGYQVAKIRRERRRLERRQAHKDRRAGTDRRQRQDGPPASGERRTKADRRQISDRRKAEDRRTKRDRRAERDPES